MAAADRSWLSARYSAARIAAAAGAAEDVAAFVFGAQAPAGFDAAKRAEAVELGARADTALADAWAEVAGAAAAHYAVPVLPPFRLRRLAADLALAALCGDVVPDDLTERKGDAVQALADLRAGRLTLVGVDGRDVPRRSAVRIAPATVPAIDTTGY